MARTREFDRSTVLDLAMQVFWQHGFAETSMQKLVERMGICRSSLYDSFGSKEALYQEAIDRYATLALDHFRDRLPGTGSAHEAISALFNGEVETLLAAENPACLLLRTSLSRCEHCPESEEKVARFFEDLTALFREELKRGRDAGEFRADLDLDAAAEHLVTALFGIKAQGAIPGRRKTIERVAAVALSILEPPKSTANP